MLTDFINLGVVFRNKNCFAKQPKEQSDIAFITNENV